jgi:NADPH2:quinone reductase
VPKGLSAIEAASLPETFFTVYSNVFGRARLAEGETLLVQGGSSGIGVTAIQIATALGHRVFATAGTDDKCRACENLGAERGINYRTEDFSEVVKSLTDGKGVNVIIDMVAGDYVNREINCLADDGRIVIIALLGGVSGNINFGEVLRRRLVVTGSTLRPRPISFKQDIAQQLQQRIWPLLEAGKIKPVIFKTFSLDQAAQAHTLMETSTHVGKIMLQVV